MDRTVPPGIPEGEAADGVADAEDRASRAPSRTRASRVKQASQARKRIPDSKGVLPRVR